jgi:hypothetical protein
MPAATSMDQAFHTQHAAMDQAMQQDIDAHAANAGVAGGPILPDAAQQNPMPDFQTLMQGFLQMMWQATQQQASQPGQAASTAAIGPQVGASRPWQNDSHLANVRLDERAFRRIEKFGDRKEDWKDWRSQVMNAVRECDKTFADKLVTLEKLDDPIEDVHLSVVEQQLSATLQSRLINVTAKEAFAIVTAAEGQGVEAWRQLNKRFDPQTDARFALLIITLVSYKIGTKQDVQSGLVKWEAMLLALERDHNERLSPKVRRALLLNILPNALQSRLLEHLDRLTD